MVNKEALAAAKAMFSKQLCPGGGYRSNCASGAKCLYNHHDDKKGWLTPVKPLTPKTSPVVKGRRRTLTPANRDKINGDTAKQQQNTNTKKPRYFTILRYCPFTALSDVEFSPF